MQEKQIMQSFKEKKLEEFDNNFWHEDTCNAMVVGLKTLGCDCQKAKFESFISQTIDQTVEEVVNRLESKKQYYKQEKERFLEEDKILLAYDFDSRYVAISQFLSNLTSSGLLKDK